MQERQWILFCSAQHIAITVILNVKKTNMINFNKIKRTKTKLLLTIITISLLTFTGCKMTVLKVFYGLKNPKTENEKSILKCAKKKELSQDNIYCFNQEDWIWAINNLSYAKSIPDIMVFDKNGNLLKYREESQCNAQAFSFLLSLTKESQFEYDSLLVMKDLTTKLKDLKGNNVSITENETTDYYVFLFWAVWIGRLNKDHVKEWENDASNNTNCNIEVIKINMDMQEWWE